MKVDMSPKAVKDRLKLVSQLWRLSLSLRKAKKETEKQRMNKSISLNSDKNLTIQQKSFPE
jgi:hypothetical protein